MANKDELWDVCQKFIKEQQITCAETIYQADRVIMNAFQFIEDICDVVGYVKDDDDTEDD